MAVTFSDNRKAWDAMQDRVKASNGMLVKIGFIEGESRAESNRGGGITNVELAELYEWGSPGGKIAEHSFLRAAYDQHQSELVVMAAKLLGKVIAGEITETKALGLLGVWFQSKVKNFIASGQVQPETKGGVGVTLADTGQLLNAITWAVEKR